MLGIDQLDRYYQECEEIQKKIDNNELSEEDKRELRERSNEIFELLRQDKEDKCYYT